MGENTKIEWADHSFSPWWGCVRVDIDCKNCYAESNSKRWGHFVWGRSVHRRFFSDKHWNEPLRWNKKAIMKGKVDLVFCGSMCDVFEDRVDLVEPRARLFELIEATDNLIWMLLTKRPENIIKFLDPTTFLPHNAWLGLSAGDGRILNGRLPAFQTACNILNPDVKFLSAEPLIGPLDLPEDFRFDWIIAGGESGTGARPMKLTWAMDILYNALDDDIPFFFKQWGEYDDQGRKIGRKEAGRILLDKEWNETPRDFSLQDRRR